MTTMKSGRKVLALAILAVVLGGVLSNLLSLRRIQALFSRSAIEHPANNSTLASARQGNTPGAAAHVAQAAPFVLKVRYGWAVSGSHMAFGQGSERIVLCIFRL
ncbi:MAG: hypothetical protein JWO97_248 [Acidobacteria bacterium]|nr:hypothetical protein [Acidobacteriota bacterium]